MITHAANTHIGTFLQRLLTDGISGSLGGLCVSLLVVDGWGRWIFTPVCAFEVWQLVMLSFRSEGRAILVSPLSLHPHKLQQHLLPPIFPPDPTRSTHTQQAKQSATCANNL